MGLQIITTVLEAASSYDLTTLANVKGDLGLTDTSQDDWLSLNITRCSGAIATYCNRIFQAEQVKDVFLLDRDAYPYQVPGGVAPLQVSRWPIQPVGGDVVAPVVIEDGTTLVESADYQVDYANGQLTRINVLGYPCMWPAKVISVQYTGGFSTVPVDVEDACARLVKTRWFARQRDPMLRGETIPGVYQANYWVPATPDAGNMPPDVADIISRYRVPVAR